MIGQVIAIARRPEFDRERTFVVIKRGGFMTGTTFYREGQAVDKTLFTTRRLRQMYDAKWLAMAEKRVKNGLA